LKQIKDKKEDMEIEGHLLGVVKTQDPEGRLHSTARLQEQSKTFRQYTGEGKSEKRGNRR